MVSGSPLGGLIHVLAVGGHLLADAFLGGRSSQQHRVLFTSSREELESAEDETAHKLVIPKALLVNQPNVSVAIFSFGDCTGAAL